MVTLAVASYATAKLGLRLASVNPLVTAVWPTMGVAVAGLLLLGRRAWPGVALAAFLANLTSGVTPLLAACITVGDTLAPLTAATLLRAWRAAPDLSRLGDVVALLAAGVAGMLVGASLRTLSLLATGAVSLTSAPRVWLVWWLGDAMGVVLVTPLLLGLAARAEPGAPRSHWREVESLAVLLLAGLTFPLVFGSTPTLVFLAFPVMLWSAVRLPQRAVAALNLIVAGSATWATLHGQGPFRQTRMDVALITLQAFIATMACTSLILSAVVRERTLAHRRLREAATGLEAAVERRTAELSTTRRALADTIEQHRRTEETLRQSEGRPLSVATMAEDPEDGHEIGAANQATEAGFDEDRPVVLHVADVHGLRVHMRRVLAGDYNLYLAANGREGLELTHRYRPDLVIVDEIMPRMSGTEFVRELRSDPDVRTTPVIVVTALADAEARAAGLRLGAEDYLSRPFHEGEFRARVRNLLNARIQKRLLLEANRRLEVRIEEQLAELARTGELRRFLPRTVGDRLLAGDLGPQHAMVRTRVTVLILGVAGFTRLAEQLEPEDLAELVNSYLGAVTAVAASHGGVVDHLAADGLMVLFGAPHGGEVEDHAWSAVQAALAMRERLVEVATACRTRGIAIDLQVRVGINTGHATIGIFGSDLLLTYTAMGAVVSLAARLRAEAAHGQILCGGTTHAAVSDRVLSRRRAPLTRSGAGRPVEVYELCEVMVPTGDGDSGGTVELAGDPQGWPLDAVQGRRVFHREGGYWTIAFDGPVLRLPDSKGLRYLALLLAHPGTEFHVLQLVAADRGAAAGPGGAEWAVPVTGRGDLGEMLDAPARAAYRRRLEELQQELDEATSFNDPERVARARAEMDALRDQLAGALGLSGRGRRPGSDVERARVNLTKRIRAAMAAIGEHDPQLEHHLRGAVRTGTFCCYAPDPADGHVWRV